MGGVNLGIFRRSMCNYGNNILEKFCALIVIHRTHKCNMITIGAHIKYQRENMERCILSQNYKGYQIILFGFFYNNYI